MSNLLDDHYDYLSDEKWLHSSGLRLVADYLLGDDHHALSACDPTFRVALFARLFGRKGIRLMMMREKP